MDRISRREAPPLAAEEYRRMATLAADLAPGEWERATCCPGWTVREVVAHVAGAMAGTSLREGSRQRKLAGQRLQTSGRTFLDEMNQLHIDDRAAAGTDELVEELRRRAAPAVKARRRVRGPLRRVQIPNGDLTMGELLDEVLTRDVWMHRIDACQATGPRRRASRRGLQRSRLTRRTSIRRPTANRHRIEALAHTDSALGIHPWSQQDGGVPWLSTPSMTSTPSWSLTSWPSASGRSSDLRDRSPLIFGGQPARLMGCRRAARSSAVNSSGPPRRSPSALSGGAEGAPGVVEQVIVGHVERFGDADAGVSRRGDVSSG